MKKIHFKIIICFLLLVAFLSGCDISVPESNNTKELPASPVESTVNVPTDTPKQTSAPKEKTKSVKVESGTLTVHFLDVGQGNACLVTCDGHSMLIDGGDREASSFVVSYLKKQGIHTLDYVIASHYDSDHLNGIVGAIHAFKIKKLLAPNYTTDSNIYNSYLNACSEKNLTAIHPKRGTTYALGKAHFTVVCPSSYAHEEENNNSIGIRLINGKNRFLILGDAEAESEQEMLASGEALDTDVYLASHHGSNGASSSAFLFKVQPSFTIISVGKNSYGHPSAGTLSRLKATGTKLFRTDTNGTIIAKSNGKTITWNTKPTTNWSSGGKLKSNTNKTVASSDGAAYIGNVKTKKFHRSSCNDLPYEKNRVYFKSRKDAISSGYSPCKRCNP